MTAVAQGCAAFRPGARRPMGGLLLAAALLLLASKGALAQTCTVASGAVLSFPGTIALASSGDQTTDSGQSFSVSCDSSVVGTLRLYSATPRVMSNNVYSLPFNLSLNNGAASNDLAATSPGTSFNIPRDGQAQPVTLYARILSQNFRHLPGGLYSVSITLTVEY